jgi:ATP citrate (pro-S)-lyase
MTMLEMNPFTLDQSGQAFPLDVRMELDDTAKFRSVGRAAQVQQESIP